MTLPYPFSIAVWTSHNNCTSSFLNSFHNYFLLKWSIIVQLLVKIIEEPFFFCPRGTLFIRLLKVFHFYYCNLSSFSLHHESKITVYEMKINVVVLSTSKSDKNRKFKKHTNSNIIIQMLVWSFYGAVRKLTFLEKLILILMFNSFLNCWLLINDQ
jgi:hypothetical protein